MSQSLVIRFNEVITHAKSEVEWFLFDQNKRLLHKDKTPVADIEASIAEQEKTNLHVSIIVSNDSALLARVDIPSQNAHQIKQALPYVVEELIAQEIEHVHMALPYERDTETQLIDVAIVNHSYLINCLDLLYHNNISPDTLVIDTLCVPYDGGISIMIDGDHALLRTSKYQGLRCQLQDLPRLLDKNSDPDNSQQNVKVLLSGESSLDDLNLNHDVETVHYKEDVAETLAATLLQDPHTINLLQGGYKQGQNTDSGWQTWKFLGVACAVSLILFAIVHLASGLYFNTKSEDLHKKSISYYKQLFPAERRVVNPKRQLENHLRRSAGSNRQFLELLQQVSDEFKHFSQDGALIINQMRYSDDSADLQLEIRGDSIEKLDQLKQQLLMVGLNASIESARAQDGYVLSNVTIGISQ